MTGIKDINQLAANTLDGSNIQIGLGIPVEKEELEGIIGGSPPNKEFKTKYPIYPANSKTFAPTPDDIKTITRKAGTPPTDIDVAVSNLETGIDIETGFTVYNTPELTTAPDDETADKVLGSYHAYHDLYVQQSLKPKEDQDTGDLKRLGSKQVYTKFGTIKTQYEVECVLADLQAILLTYKEAEDQTGVETGATLFERRDTPQTLKAFVPIFNGEETDDPYDRSEIGRIYLQGVKIPPVLPEAKAGDDVTVKLTLYVGDKPNILVYDEYLS